MTLPDPFDAILVHAPSVYDFRERDDVLFAYLSNSDSVHVSSIFEMPPVGMIALHQHLAARGFAVECFNVASKMLHDPSFDVEQFFRRAPSRLLGIDLHWTAHAHGALALARLYKTLHPRAKVVLGGISATYYHEELVGYDEVDYVIRGFDTLAPMERLVEARGDAAALGRVPNLTWKDAGETHVNPMSHLPDTYGAVVNWRDVFASHRTATTPYSLVIPQAGCEYDCRWCGGGRYFYRRQYGLKKPVQKSAPSLRSELESIAAAPTRGHTVTMIDFWHEYPALLDVACNAFVDETVRTVHFSVNRLPNMVKTGRMTGPVRAVIELSPDSHDHAVGVASGRGHYTMEEMEAFIDATIDEVYSFEIYFMLGLPSQTVETVWETVAYCEHLLDKYHGRRVIPFICPMLPFLDPGSEFFEHPERSGYTIFHRTLEEHRRALVRMHWRDRLNYETRWMSREELVAVSYASVRELTGLKARHRLLPRSVAERVTQLIDDTVAMLDDIDAWQQAPPSSDRDRAGEALRRRIAAYNRTQFQQVRSQQRPVDLGFSRQQWFDTEAAFARIASGS